MEEINATHGEKKVTKASSTYPRQWAHFKASEKTVGQEVKQDHPRSKHIPAKNSKTHALKCGSCLAQLRLVDCVVASPRDGVDVTNKKLRF